MNKFKPGDLLKFTESVIRSGIFGQARNVSDYRATFMESEIYRIRVRPVVNSPDFAQIPVHHWTGQDSYIFELAEILTEDTEILL